MRLAESISLNIERPLCILKNRVLNFEQSPLSGVGSSQEPTVSQNISTTCSIDPPTVA